MTPFPAFRPALMMLSMVTLVPLILSAGHSFPSDPRVSPPTMIGATIGRT